MKEIITDLSTENQRLDKLLKRLMPLAGASFIYKMLRKKNIKLNDKRALGSEILSAGDKISIYLSDETLLKMGYGKQKSDTTCENSDYIKAYNNLKGIKIVYENDDCVIFYKPEGILSQKANASDLSLNEYLIGYLLSSGSITYDKMSLFKPAVLNRLDRNTKGLIICGKSLKGSRVLSQMIKDRSLRKYYKARVCGEVFEKMLLEGFLYKDERTNTVKIYDKKPEGKRTAQIKTYIEPLKKEDDITLIKIELITGKSHQIRAQMAHIGHPVLGDTKYGKCEFNKRYNIFKQDLTAYRLEFPMKCEIKELSGRIIEI